MLDALELMMGSYIWILGVGVSVSLALAFTLYMHGREKTFLGCLTLFLGFSAWGGIVPTYFFTASFIVFLLISGYELTKHKGIP